jgi:hypothetical protein
MEGHNAQQATGEENAVIIKCENFVRPGDGDAVLAAVDTCFQAYPSILTLHIHNLGKAAVPNSIIASGHLLHSAHCLSRDVQVPGPMPSSARRLHQSELLPAYRSGTNSELRKASRAFSQRKCRGFR